MLPALQPTIAHVLEDIAPFSILDQQPFTRELDRETKRLPLGRTGANVARTGRSRVDGQWIDGLQDR